MNCIKSEPFDMNFSCSLQSRLFFFYSRLIIEQVDSRGVCRDDDDDDFCSAHTKQGGVGEPRNASDEFTQPIDRLRGRRRSGFMRTFELSLIARRHARYENGAFCLLPPLPFWPRRPQKVDILPRQTQSTASSPFRTISIN